MLAALAALTFFGLCIEGVKAGRPQPEPDTGLSFSPLASPLSLSFSCLPSCLLLDPLPSSSLYVAFKGCAARPHWPTEETPANRVALLIPPPASLPDVHRASE